jgi:hypothetical protein
MIGETKVPHLPTASTTKTHTTNTISPTPTPNMISPTPMTTVCCLPLRRMMIQLPTQLDWLRTGRLIPVLHSHSDSHPVPPDAMTLEVLKRKF